MLDRSEGVPGKLRHRPDVVDFRETHAGLLAGHEEIRGGGNGKSRPRHGAVKCCHPALRTFGDGMEAPTGTARIGAARRDDARRLEKPIVFT